MFFCKNKFYINIPPFGLHCVLGKSLKLYIGSKFYGVCWPYLVKHGYCVENHYRI